MTSQDASYITRALDREQNTQHHVTFRFNEETTNMITACSIRAAKGRSKALSKPATIRLLIDLHIDLGLNQQAISAEKMILISDNPQDWLRQDTCSQLSLTITEAQRVAIRKLEFELQKLDWSINLDRGDTIQLLIMSYGNLVKQQSTAS